MKIFREILYTEEEYFNFKEFCENVGDMVKYRETYYDAESGSVSISISYNNREYTFDSDFIQISNNSLNIIDDIYVEVDIKNIEQYCRILLSLDCASDIVHISENWRDMV